MGRLGLHALLLAATAAFALKFVQSTQSTGLPGRMVVLMILTLITFALAAHRPVYAVYAMLIVAPFYSYLRRLYLVAEPFQGQVSFDPVHLLPETLLILALVLAYSTRRQTDQLPTLEKSPGVAKPLAVFIGLALLQIFNPLTSSVLAAANVFRVNYMGLLAYYLPMRLGFGMREIRSVVTIALATSSVAALYGLKQAFLGFNDGERIWIASFPKSVGPNLYKIFSTLNSAGHFANFMMIGIILGVGSFLICRTASMRLLAIVAIPTCIAGILLSMVRSSWFGAIAGLVFLLAISPIRTRNKRIGAMVLMAVASFGLSSLTSRSGSALDQDFTSRSYQQALQRQQETLFNPLRSTSVQGRVAQVTTALPWIARHPLGAGLGASTDFEKGAAPPVENQFLIVTQDCGWIGLIVYLVILYEAAAMGFHIQDRLVSGELRWVCRTATSLLVGAVVASLAGTHISTHPLDLYTWLLLGILPALPSIEADMLQGGPESAACCTPPDTLTEY